jgi:uncharacterized protein
MLSSTGHTVTHSTAGDGPSQGPVRTCVGCRERGDRSMLLRVAVVEVEGILSVVPDPRHRLPGRGASLHPELRCLELAERRRAFTRALRQGVPLDSAPVREYVQLNRPEPSSRKRVQG